MDTEIVGDFTNWSGELEDLTDSLSTKLRRGLDSLWHWYVASHFGQLTTASNVPHSTSMAELDELRETKHQPQLEG